LIGLVLSPQPQPDAERRFRVTLVVGLQGGPEGSVVEGDATAETLDDRFAHSYEKNDVTPYSCRGLPANVENSV
jgi:hypothetical protein